MRPRVCSVVFVCMLNLTRLYFFFCYPCLIMFTHVLFDLLHFVPLHFPELNHIYHAMFTHTLNNSVKFLS
jgi:hypothetical protein